MVLRLSHCIFNVFLIFLQEITNSSIYYTLIQNSSRDESFRFWCISDFQIRNVQSEVYVHTPIPKSDVRETGYYICNSLVSRVDSAALAGCKSVCFLITNPQESFLKFYTQRITSSKQRKTVSSPRDLRGFPPQTEPPNKLSKSKKL